MFVLITFAAVFFGFSCDAIPDLKVSLTNEKVSIIEDIAELETKAPALRKRFKTVLEKIKNEFDIEEGIRRFSKARTAIETQNENIKKSWPEVGFLKWISISYFVIIFLSVIGIYYGSACVSSTCAFVGAIQIPIFAIFLIIAVISSDFEISLPHNAVKFADEQIKTSKNPREKENFQTLRSFYFTESGSFPIDFHMNIQGQYVLHAGVNDVAKLIEGVSDEKIANDANKISAEDVKKAAENYPKKVWKKYEQLPESTYEKLARIPAFLQKASELPDDEVSRSIKKKLGDARQKFLDKPEKIFVSSPETGFNDAEKLNASKNNQTQNIKDNDITKNIQNQIHNNNLSLNQLPNLSQLQDNDLNQLQNLDRLNINDKSRTDLNYADQKRRMLEAQYSGNLLVDEILGGYVKAMGIENIVEDVKHNFSVFYNQFKYFNDSSDEEVVATVMNENLEIKDAYLYPLAHFKYARILQKNYATNKISDLGAIIGRHVVDPFGKVFFFLFSIYTFMEILLVILIIKVMCAKENDEEYFGLDGEHFGLDVKTERQRVQQQIQRVQKPDTIARNEVYRREVKEDEDSIPALNVDIKIDSDRFPIEGRPFGEENFICVGKEIGDIQELNLEFQNQLQDEGMSATKIETLKI